MNLTGNSASGQRGNQRQIDIRGMGPENVLILIDGKPVTSRNTVRMGRQGERNTRGDSQWVPPELVERIEVIRGPAAARYGSGAAGGVVNIVTKKPDTRTASFGLHYNMPESDDEGATRRANLMFAGPLGERLSYGSGQNMGVIFVVAARAKVSSLRVGLPWTYGLQSKLPSTTGRSALISLTAFHDPTG
ncbi:hypothetical protein ATO2_18925 [Roseovarius sp. 22II1-1F6A]|nr:hypothetical protein ATO2_18925 [Roseovarius sp. 22II1-1F6A]